MEKLSFWSVIYKQKESFFWGILSIVVITCSLFALAEMSGDLFDTWNNFFHFTLEQGLTLSVLFFVLALGSYGRQYAFASIAQKSFAQLRQQLLVHLMASSSEFQLTHSPDRLTRLLIEQIIFVQGFICTLFSISLRNSLMFCGGVVMMFLTSWQLALGALLMIPIFVTAFSWGISQKRSVEKKLIFENKNFFEFLSEVIQNLSYIQSLNAQNTTLEYLSQQEESTQNLGKKTFFWKGVLSGEIIFFGAIYLLFLLFLGSELIQQEQLTLGTWVTFFVYLLITSSSLSHFSNISPQWEKTQYIFMQWNQLLQHSVSFQDPPKQNSKTLAPSGVIAFHHVSFSYPNSPEVKTIDEVTFSIHPGEKVGIVGLSGAGKRTLFRLMLGFFHPQSGHIYLDGKPLPFYSREDIGNRMCFAPQDPVIFSTTLHTNLSLANPYADLEQIMEALKQADLLDLVNNLPQGIYTKVGNEGIHLSHSQKQRLSYARAFLKNPNIFLLEETPTSVESRIDYQAEQRLNNFMKKRTTIVIAHRLNTILSCDKILVINKGKIESVGTHGELMLQCPFYKHLIHMYFKLPANQETSP